MPNESHTKQQSRYLRHRANSLQSDERSEDSIAIGWVGRSLPCLARRPAVNSPPRREKFDPAEIRALFTNGTPVMRVMVLGLMGGDPSLVDAASLAQGIARPATRTEQFQALKLAERLWERFSEPERAMLRAATQRVPIAKNSRRAPLAEKILAKSVAS
jgi:hypothetical protein